MSQIAKKSLVMLSIITITLSGVVMSLSFPKTNALAIEQENNTVLETIVSEDASNSSTQVEGDFIYFILGQEGSPGTMSIITGYIGSDRDVIIPSTLGGYPVQRIIEPIFANNLQLDSVTIPEGVSALASGAFSNSSVKTINLPSTIKYLSNNTFRKCQQLREINVSEGSSDYCCIDGNLYNKDQTKFYFYASGKEERVFTLPSTVITVSDGAFSGANNLETLNIPDSVTSTGGFGDSSIKVVNIGKGVKNYSTDLAPDNLEQFNVDVNNPFLTSEDGVLFDKQQTVLIKYPTNRNEQCYIVPDSVVAVEERAFYWCPNLQEIIFSSKIGSLGNYSIDPPEHTLKRVVFREGISSGAISSESIRSAAMIIGDDSVAQAMQSQYYPGRFLNSDLSKNILTLSTVTYTGEPLIPEILFGDYGIKLEEGRDYQIILENNINAGQANVAISGIGDFGGNTTSTFTIKKANIQGASMDYPQTVEYAGTSCMPKPSLTWNGHLLQEDFDYILTYENNDYPNTQGRIYVHGIGNFEGVADWLFFNITYPNGTSNNSTNDSDTKKPNSSNNSSVKPGESNNTSNLGNTSNSNTQTDGSINSSDQNTANKTPTNQPNKATAKWMQQGNKWWYRHADGSYTKNSWEQINGVWYHFDNAGYMQTGWQKIGGSWYYLKSNGTMTTNWTNINGHWYYMNNGGVMQTGWQKIGDTWYYLDSTGAMATGWLKIRNNWYYFDKNGAMNTSWKKDGNSWYYFNNNGSMCVAWQKVGKSWYYFSGNGVMQTGWQKIGNKWYYFADNGAMKTGWNKVNGTWYYHNASGVMITGWNDVDGTWYYHNETGALAKGWQTIGGKWYYFDKSGLMVVDQWVGNYYVKRDGTLARDEWIGNYYVGKDGKWNPNSSQRTAIVGEWHIYQTWDTKHDQQPTSSMLPHSEFCLQVYSDGTYKVREAATNDQWEYGKWYFDSFDNNGIPWYLLVFDDNYYSDLGVCVFDNGKTLGFYSFGNEAIYYYAERA